MNFNQDMNQPDLLNDFDFEQFLQNTDAGEFNFDSGFVDTDGIEAGMPGV